ncbi:LETM1 domain-containing protein mdm28, mitochondrial [Smittium mucronatum]|uniref:LETM1 domain-containing protein mdm28, mitochondrial n=1 Tax=Smittium mucronatum TaxID=133383 RepID=A0A1R0GYS2_9FUNG|nr:LETM1 domain-containing protein mdm28, mitochondrial [Smittium mucronatum]
MLHALNFSFYLLLLCPKLDFLQNFLGGVCFSGVRVNLNSQFRVFSLLSTKGSSFPLVSIHLNDRSVSNFQLNRFSTKTTETEAKKAGSSSEQQSNPNVEVSIPKEKKPPLWDRIKNEAHHYWNGTKLFGQEIKISTILFAKMLSGADLSRRENRQLKRTLIDLARLLPFSMFVIIPFAELLLPFALKIFPNLLPSTYEDKANVEKKRLSVQKTRAEVSRYLRDTIKEGMEQKKMVLLESGDVVDNAKIDKVEDLLASIRSSGEKVSTEEVLQLVSIFGDEMTLDNLTRPQLVSICRYLDIQSFGTDNYLKYQIRKRMKYIRADDKVIDSEGIDTLTVTELQAACMARGIKSIGSSPAKMRSDLELWIELHLKQNTPSVILILSRILSATDSTAKPASEVLQATLSSLPDTLVNEATLAAAEGAGLATNKQRLEVLKEQIDLIKDESEQEQESQEVLGKLQQKDGEGLTSSTPETETTKASSDSEPPKSTEKSA